MTRREDLAWNAMLFQFGLVDPHISGEFKITSTKKFSWMNSRRRKAVISRIDRFYFSPRINQLGVGSTTGIDPTLAAITDHAPISLTINKLKPRTKTKPGFNKILLKTPTGR